MAQFTPEQFADQIERYARGYPQAVARAALVAAQQLEADITGRIFRVGGTKDISGETRGYRSESWVEEREDKGLQVVNVDHVFTGNLKRSPRLFQTRKHIDLKIVGKKNVDKARGNERWYDSGVFEASKSEEQRAREVFEEEMVDYRKKFFN